MSTDSQPSVPEAPSSPRERGQPLSATPDLVKGVWSAVGISGDRSKSVTSEEDSLFSASSRLTGETTPEYSDIESKAAAVRRWATTQPTRPIAVDELAGRLSAAAAGQQKPSITTTAPADHNPNASQSTETAPPLMTSAIPIKAPSPHASTKPIKRISVASLLPNSHEAVPRKNIIRLKRCVLPAEPQYKPLKTYTSKKPSREKDTATTSDFYDFPDESDSATPPTNRLKPTKKTEQRRPKKPKTALPPATSATVDNDSGHELARPKKRNTPEKRPSSTPTADSDSDSDFVPPTKTKKRKPPQAEKQPAAKKSKTGKPAAAALPSPPASSSSASDRPKLHYELRAAEMRLRPLDFDDCVRDDPRPGKAQRIRRVFRRFRREQGEPISAEIRGARNPPDPSSGGEKKWGKPYQPGSDGGVVVGWTKNKARRFWGNEVNKCASEYAKRR